MAGRKSEILAKAKAAGLFGLARKRSAKGVRILCYHGLWLGNDRFAGDSMFMQEATFVRRLEIIRREGYPVVPLHDAIEALAGRGPQLPPAAVVVTIDDGWWSTRKGMLPALQSQGMPATLYCDTAQLMGEKPIGHVMTRYLDLIAAAALPPDRARLTDVTNMTAARAKGRDLDAPMDARIAGARALASALGIDPEPYFASRAFSYMTPDELAGAVSQGLDVQLHTHRHTLGDMSQPVIEDEIRANRAALSGILNKPAAAFNHFCYPSGVATPAAARILAGIQGLQSSTTTVQGIAWPGMPMHLLPRLLDGENMTEIEFEAELCGLGDWLRRGKHAAQRLRDTVQPARHET
jgi:peptidoglycan/xylan/chitin deacetylase (PgdA/CDA1 family)